MRPRLIEFLQKYTGADIAAYLIPTGTMMYVLAILAVMYIYVKRCEHSGLSGYHALGTCIFAIIGGLAGARLFYLLETLPETTSDPLVILNIFGGTTSWGVYIGGFAGFFVYLRRHRLRSFEYADVMGASLGLGPFIGRWSCFLHGCCYGTPATLPWAISYPPSSPLFWHQVKLGLISGHSPLSLPAHPLPVYLSLSALAVFFLATIIWKKYRLNPGITFLFYWLMYCSLRFFWEYFRGNAKRWGFMHWDLGQIVCIAVVLISGLMLIYFKRRKFSYTE